MTRRTTWVAGAGGAVAALLVLGGTGPAGSVARQRAVDPADFAHPVANAYFPLTPGTTVWLRGTDEGERFRERVHVTGRTKLIQGVTTVVVTDVLRRADGSLAESTRDWYAADDLGAVWYFGEDTATYRRDGSVESREGSWQAGVDGARAGLVMPAAPHATQAFRQEYDRGNAEDQAWVVRNGGRATVPLGRFRHVVRTFEWSRLEPGVISTKLYARGVGIIREHDLSGGDETFEAVRVRH